MHEQSIGGLWLKTGKNGTRYMSGEIDGRKVVVFKNDHKREGEKTPDYRVYPSKPQGGGSRDDDSAPF